MTHREFAAATRHAVLRHDAVEATHPSRERLAQVAEVLDDADLEMHGRQRRLLGRGRRRSRPSASRRSSTRPCSARHNFVANGIAVHNSIEQDADVVILLHREDAYDQESPRAGEADVIVAKHRNGPTDTIVVAFQGHYSRFNNMARDGGF